MAIFLSSFEKTKLFLAVKLFAIWQLVLLQMTEADISMVTKAIDTGFIPVSLNSSSLSPKLPYFFALINIFLATQLFFSLVLHMTQTFRPYFYLSPDIFPVHFRRQAYHQECALCR